MTLGLPPPRRGKTHSTPTLGLQFLQWRVCRLVEEFLLNAEDRSREREAGGGGRQKAELSDSGCWGEQ